MIRRWPLVAAVASVLLTVGATSADASTVPSGERMLGRNGIEPVYDAETGAIGYTLIPVNAPDPVKADPRSWAPMYVPVYPVSVSTDVGTLLCQHTPVENCPSHGDPIAGLAQSLMPTVYGGGVLGHDHLMDLPGGDDFNIAWEPIVVLFTSTDAAREHITTEAQIDAAVARGDAIEIPLPQLTFTCTAVPASVYGRATPIV